MDQSPRVRARVDAATLPEHPAVRVEDLVRRFGKVTALDHVSLEVAPGEIFGLIGPNGAGKSTLLKILTTLLPPTSGRAVVAGFDVRRNPAEVRARIGYVPQLPSADRELTGIENLQLSTALYLIPRAERAARIEAALKSFGLWEARNRQAGDYSGGMLRRLEIAQSTIHHPEVLFLDEPTVGLDPTGRAAVWEHVLELRRELGAAVVMTTHYMDEAEDICDRIAIVARGRVAGMGTPAELETQGGAHVSLDEVFAHLTGEPVANKEGRR